MLRLLTFVLTAAAVNFKTTLDDMCIEYVTQFTCSSYWCDPENGSCYSFQEGSCSMPIECSTSERRFVSSNGCGEVLLKYFYTTCDLCPGGQTACRTVQNPEINDYPFGEFDQDGTYRMLSAEEDWWGPLHSVSQSNPTIYSNRPNFLYLTVIIPIAQMNSYSADPITTFAGLGQTVADHMNIAPSRVWIVLFIMCHRSWIPECYTISGAIPSVWQQYVQATSMPSVTMVGLTTAIEIDPDGQGLRSEFTQLVEDVQTDQFTFFADQNNRTYVETLLLNYPELDDTYYTKTESEESETANWILWIIAIFCISCACCVIIFVARNRTCSEEDADWDRTKSFRSWTTSMHSRFTRSFYTYNTSVAESSDSDSETRSKKPDVRNENIVSAFGIQGRSKRLTRKDYQEHQSRKELRELAYETKGGGDYEHTFVPSQV